MSRGRVTAHMTEKMSNLLIKSKKNLFLEYGKLASFLVYKIDKVKEEPFS
jgi:hypothetical protein